MKRKITVLVMAGLMLGLITDLIAYASSVWIKGTWSTDLEVVLSEAPESADIQAAAPLPVDDIEDETIPSPTASVVDDMGDAETPSTPSDIPITTDGETPSETVSAVFVIVAVEPEETELYERDEKN